MDKSAGDRVIAGTVNGQGSLRVEVTGTGDETALAGIMRLVEQAQTSRSRAQLPGGPGGVLPHHHRHRLRRHHRHRLATPRSTLELHDRARSDRARDRLSPCAGSGHPAGDSHLDHDWRAERPACARSTHTEEARLLNTVVFDKTGTLTLGSHRVVKTTPAAEGFTDDEVLRVAASVQRDAEHPIAQALMTSAKEHGINVPMSQDFESMPGRGVRAVVEERSLHVGGPGLLKNARRRTAGDPSAGCRISGSRWSVCNLQASWIGCSPYLRSRMPSVPNRSTRSSVCTTKGWRLSC
ncbi:hypothetical protein RLIN73S_00154 [Rhodanobacter lindaniclasticus]